MWRLGPHERAEDLENKYESGDFDNEYKLVGSEEDGGGDRGTYKPPEAAKAKAAEAATADKAESAQQEQGSSSSSFQRFFY